MRTIYKHAITVTVLSESPTLPGDLDVIAERCNAGDDIGQITGRTVSQVSSEALNGELVAIGNDGTFFDYECDESY